MRMVQQYDQIGCDHYCHDEVHSMVCGKKDCYEMEEEEQRSVEMDERIVQGKEMMSGDGLMSVQKK